MCSLTSKCSLPAILEGAGFGRCEFPGSRSLQLSLNPYFLGLPDCLSTHTRVNLNGLTVNYGHSAKILNALILEMESQYIQVKT